MKLQYVSVTGADEAVDLKALNALAGQYPFAEFALLWLPEQAGQPRCPSAAWIQNFAANFTGAHKALHLCGSAFLAFANGDEAIIDLMRGFYRIQLNLEFGAVKGRYDEQALIERVKSLPQWQFIFQYTPVSAKLLSQLASIKNHAILFDQSAGRGISPQSWPVPLLGHFCGYAGGLNPGNLQHNLDLIADAAGGEEIWIDMETGVRTDDCFDLNKVRLVFEISAPYVA